MMTKKIVKIGFLLLAFLWMSDTMMAQKYGHLNSGNLLALMPEAQKADEDLVKFQESLFTAYEAKIADFRKRGNAFIEKAQGGTLSQVEIQTQQAKLEKEQQDLANEEQEIMGKVQQKRQELLEPILNKVDEAIQAIGKEGNYAMIFDTSKINTILFVQESDDLMPQVKQRLGIK